MDKKLMVRTEANKTGSLDLNKFIFNNINIKKTDNILELGCGNGYQTLEFAARADKVIGVDLLGKALQQVRKYKKSNIILKKCDMDYFFANNKDKYDIIASIYALYYSKDAEKLLYKAMQALKDNGKIIIVGPYGNNNNELFRLIGTRNIDKYVRFTCTDFMENVVLKFLIANFENIKITTAKNRVEFASAEALLKYWQSTVFYDERLEKGVATKIRYLYKNKFFITKSIMLIEASNAKN